MNVFASCLELIFYLFESPAHNEPIVAPPAKRATIPSNAPATNATIRSKPEAATDAAPLLPTQAKIVSVRGVEHVQMPLFVYEGEQKMMRDELKYWKNIVREFRDMLNDVDFS